MNYQSNIKQEEESKIKAFFVLKNSLFIYMKLLQSVIIALVHIMFYLRANCGKYWGLTLGFATDAPRCLLGAWKVL